MMDILYLNPIPHEYVGPDGWFVYAPACLKNLEKLRLECFMDFLRDTSDLGTTYSAIASVRL